MELAKAIERSAYKQGNKERISWFNVAMLMGENRSPEYYRAQYRRQMGTHDPKQKVRVSANKAKAQGHTEPKSILVQELKKTRTIDELIKATGMSRLEVLGTIEELRLNGYDIIQARYGDEVAYSVNQKIEQTFADYKHYHTASKKIKIGIVSDTHMGSKYFQKSFLDRAYDDFMEKGITDVYHAGDITDGFYTNRPSSIYELYAIGFDQQLDDVVDNYPKRDGITTYFISGNHDATHTVNGGANIGKAIASRRQDMKYLGHEFAKIWLTPKVDMDMVHPRDGGSYALSYKMQKRIDAISGGSKPKVMVTGHYHKNFSMFYRNIYAMSLASFQAQSSFMRGLGLVSDVGYVILDIEVNDNGDIIEFTPTYKALYITQEEF